MTIMQTIRHGELSLEPCIKTINTDDDFIQFKKKDLYSVHLVIDKTHLGSSHLFMFPKNSYYVLYLVVFTSSIVVLNHVSL